MRNRRLPESNESWDAAALSHHGGEVDAAESAPLPSAEELGRGGGGIVTRGPDRHLPRDVAWKTAARRDVASRLRLAAEARALASLEHPNIVPIYDQDVGADGELRVALRIIQGETLAARITALHSTVARLDLLRDVLKAIQAVAWAHHRGWVHRDLKPGNIMIGAFGEVQVIDWGLAHRLDDPPDPAVEPPGKPIGTLVTMSPEQARGELASAASDVWGLGATLFEVATGRSLVIGETRAALDRLRVGDRDHVLAVNAEVPPPLAAIIERALAPHPDGRYADARSLAADLSAFLDGRRVSAHAYSPGERLARFVRRWRIPLGLGLTVLIVGLIAGVIAITRIAAERDRVVEAHARTVAALAERDREARRAGAEEASRALQADERPEAELAAARVLMIGEDATARGVLAAYGRAPRFSRKSSLPIGACLDADVDPGGRVVVCGRRDSMALYQDGVVRWTRETGNRGVALTDGGDAVLLKPHVGPLLVLDAADGRELLRADESTHNGRVRPGPEARFATVEDQVLVVIARSSGIETWRPCPGGLNQATAFTTAERVALCTDGQLVTVGADGEEPRVPTPLVSAAREFVALGILGPERVLVGSTRGVLQLVDRESGAIVASRTLAPARMVQSMLVASGGERAAVTLEGRGPMLFDTRALLSLGALPRGVYAVRWSAAGNELATRGDAIEHWRVPWGRGYRVDGLGSVSGIWVGDDVIGIAHNQGASVLEPERGGTRWHHDWGHGVTKQTLVQGDEVVVGVAVDPTLDRTHLEAERIVTTMQTVRRLLPAPNGALLRAFTGAGLELWWGRGDTLSLSEYHHNDIAVYGRWAVGFAAGPSRFILFELRDAPLALASCPDPATTVLAIGPGGRDGVTVFTLQPSRVVAWSVEDCLPERIYQAPRGELWKLAVSPDGAWVAAGTRGGELFVWRRDGTLVSTAALHAQAVSVLTTDPEGRWFVSGSWDGQLRWTDLETLGAPALALATSVMAAWTGASD